MRLIDADALLEAVADFPYGYRGMIESEIENQPTMDAVPVRHGKWIKIHPQDIYECSECHQNVMTSDIECYRFCHQCGARMDEDDYLESDYDYVEINPCKGCEDFDGKTCTSNGACGDARMVEE